MTVKEELHRLVDLLDDTDDLEEALDYLCWLAEPSETLSPEELTEVEEGEAEIARGEYVTLEEFKRSLRE